jgi:hypothetical protein
LANQLLSLPIYAELRQEQVGEVVKELEKAVLAESASFDPGFAQRRLAG